MDKQLSNPHHIPIITPLRGIAAVSVCFFHFLCGDYPLLPDDNWLEIAASYGERGVEAFFVISGFVIPYSLHLKSYRPGKFFSFFLRRIKRLEPPYIACIGIILFNYAVLGITPAFRGTPFHLDYGELLSHFTYTNNILAYPWLNPVFWTLAIELQFYLFIGVCFPLLKKRKFELRTLFLIAFIPLAFLFKGDYQYLFMWLPLFGLGMLSFLVYLRFLADTHALLLFLALSLTSVHVVGLSQALTGAVTAGIIICFGNRPLGRGFSLLSFLGTISYSLYLLHVPVGVRVIILFQRSTDGMLSRYALILSALLLSISAAYLLWRLVEVPARKWSRKERIQA